MAKTTLYICNNPCKVSKNTLGSITYLLKLGGVLHSLTKTIPYLGHSINTMAKLFWYRLSKGIAYARNSQSACNTHCKVSHKSFGLYNIFFETWRVLHNHIKTYKETNTLIRVIYN